MTPNSPLPVTEGSESTAPVSLTPDAPQTPPEKDPTFVKLAMRNMVRQGSKSMFHFALTTVGLLGLLVGLAFITR